MNIKKLVVLFLSLSTLASCSKDISFGVQSELEKIQIAVKAPWNDFSKAKKIIGLGDSHTLGYGVGNPNSYPTILSSIIGIPVVNKGVGGETSGQILNRFVKDTQDYKYPHIIWAGQNNNWSSQEIIRHVDSIVQALPHQNFFVIGTLSMEYELNYLQDTLSKYGTPHNMNYWTTTYVDSLLKDQWGDHFFAPLPYLMSKNDGSVGDLLDVYHRVTPRSKRSDILHLNSVGNRDIADTLSKLIIWKK